MTRLLVSTYVRGISVFFIFREQRLKILLKTYYSERDELRRWNNTEEHEYIVCFDVHQEV